MATSSPLGRGIFSDRFDCKSRKLRPILSSTRQKEVRPRRIDPLTFTVQMQIHNAAVVPRCSNTPPKSEFCLVASRVSALFVRVGWGSIAALLHGCCTRAPRAFGPLIFTSRFPCKSKGKRSGPEGTRTPDLRHAKAALSQLSYGPTTKLGYPST